MPHAVMDGDFTLRGNPYNTQRKISLTGLCIEGCLFLEDETSLQPLPGLSTYNEGHCYYIYEVDGLTSNQGVGKPPTEVTVNKGEEFLSFYKSSTVESVTTQLLVVCRERFHLTRVYKCKDNRQIALAMERVIRVFACSSSATKAGLIMAFALREVFHFRLIVQFLCIADFVMKHRVPWRCVPSNSKNQTGTPLKSTGSGSNSSGDGRSAGDGRSSIPTTSRTASGGSGRDDDDDDDDRRRRKRHSFRGPYDGPPSKKRKVDADQKKKGKKRRLTAEHVDSPDHKRRRHGRPIEDSQPRSSASLEGPSTSAMPVPVDEASTVQPTPAPHVPPESIVPRGALLPDVDHYLTTRVIDYSVGVDPAPAASPPLLLATTRALIPAFNEDQSMWMWLLCASLTLLTVQLLGGHGFQNPGAMSPCEPMDCDEEPQLVRESLDRCDTCQRLAPLHRCNDCGRNVCGRCREHLERCPKWF